MTRPPKFRMPFAPSSGAAATYRVFVRDLVLACRVGVHAHERDMAQRIRINLDLFVQERAGGAADRLADVVCYEDVAVAIRAIVSEGHVNLIETLAERIAQRCLGDKRAVRVLVRIEKLDVFRDAEAAGIEIERTR